MYRRLCNIVGPGLMVCLADTDGGCLITAAQSGTMFGYSLLGIQIVLIPVLFAAQELTVRLTLSTKMGLTELIKLRYGQGVAVLSYVSLLVSCVGAMISEISCISQVGLLWGIGPALSAIMVAACLMIIVLIGSYRLRGLIQIQK